MPSQLFKMVEAPDEEGAMAGAAGVIYLRPRARKLATRPRSAGPKSKRQARTNSSFVPVRFRCTAEPASLEPFYSCFILLIRDLRVVGDYFSEELGSAPSEQHID